MMNCLCCVSPGRRRLLGALSALAGTMIAGRTASAAEAQSAASGLSRTAVRSIDIHAHYYPESYCDLVGGAGKQFGGAFVCDDKSFTFQTPAGGLGPLPMKFINVDERLRDMDASGVDVQALSLSVPMAYWGDRNFNARLAREWNTAASRIYQQHPTRFVVLATLPMLNATDAIDELERASQLPGVRGVYMGTNINNRDLDDPLFLPVFARIEQLNLPVFLHPQQTVGGSRLGDFYLSNLLVSLCHKISCALNCCTVRVPSLHESLSKQDAQRSNGIRNVALSALDCPGGCNPGEGQAARVQGSFFYHAHLIAF